MPCKHAQRRSLWNLWKKEGTSWGGGGDVRIDSGETVFQKRNVKNPMLRSMADWGIRDVEIEEPGKKNLLDARVSCGAPAAVSDMKD